MTGPGPVEYAPFPTDPEAIKADIAVRREAIRIMFAEITALKQHLGRALGPEAFLEYLSAESADGADAMGVASARSRDHQDRSEWTLRDWLERDGEWRDYLAKAGWKGPDAQRPA